MQNLFEIAEREKIIVEFFIFAAPIKGIYIADIDLTPTIGLDTSLKNNTPLLRCIMAEELGHHFTSTGMCMPKEFYSYCDRLKISKAEYKALKWAALYLIPLDKLLEAVSYGICTVWEIADHFNVTEEMIAFRLRLPDIK